MDLNIIFPDAFNTQDDSVREGTPQGCRDGARMQIIMRLRLSCWVRGTTLLVRMLSTVQVLVVVGELSRLGVLELQESHTGAAIPCMGRFLQRSKAPGYPAHKCFGLRNQWEPVHGLYTASLLTQPLGQGGTLNIACRNRARFWLDGFQIFLRP